jgi:chromosome partitioning protein
MWAKAGGKAAMVRNPDLQGRVLLVSCVRGTTLANEEESLLAHDEDASLMASRLVRRFVYMECQMMGATVHALPRAGAAIAEVEALAQEVAGHLNIELPEVELPPAAFDDEVQ